MTPTVQIKRNGENFDITTNTTVLKAGEQFFDMDNGLYLIGDGESTIAELYSSGKVFSILDNIECEFTDGLEFNDFYDAWGTCSVSGYTGSNSVVKIPSYVFHNNRLYTVIKIGNRAFGENTTITRIDLSPTIVEIGDFAFIRCTNLRSIDYFKSSNSIASQKNLRIIGTSSFYGCTSLQTGSIQSLLRGNIESIGNTAFYGCTSLTTIDIPESLSGIPMGAFQNCSSLSHITIRGSSTLNIGRDAFSGIADGAAIIIYNNEDASNLRPPTTGSTIEYKTETKYVEYAYSVDGDGLLGTPGGDTETTDRAPDNIFEPGSNTVKNASNVKSKINDHDISDIFNQDGITVKNATVADKVKTLDIFDANIANYFSVNYTYESGQSVLGYYYINTTNYNNNFEFYIQRTDNDNTDTVSFGMICPISSPRKKVYSTIAYYVDVNSNEHLFQLYTEPSSGSAGFKVKIKEISFSGSTTAFDGSSWKLYYKDLGKTVSYS